MPADTAQTAGRTGVNLAGPDGDIVEGDVSEPGPWQERARGADLVIHTAAIVSNAVGGDAQWKVNVVGTRRALDAAGAAGSLRFVHLSSVRAFSDRGYPDGVDESRPVRPDGNAYVETKMASEQRVLRPIHANARQGGAAYGADAGGAGLGVHGCRGQPHTPRGAREQPGNGPLPGSQRGVLHRQGSPRPRLRAARPPRRRMRRTEQWLRDESLI